MAWLLSLLLLMVANIAVSIAVAKSLLYGQKQVLAQLCIVWLVPVVGALLVGLFLWSQRSASNSRSGHGADPENWQNAENTSTQQGD